MAEADFAFSHTLRVRWAEVDMQGVVFNGHYLTYIDVAFTEYWRATGLPDAIMQARDGRELFVRKSTIEYFSPAHFDDEIVIGCRCAAIGNSSLQMQMQIHRGDTHLISAQLIYVYADVASKTSCAVPAAWREIIDAFECR